MWNKIKKVLAWIAAFIAGAVAGFLALIGIRKKKENAVHPHDAMDAADAYKEKEDEIEKTDAAALVDASPGSAEYGARIESRKDGFRRRADSAVNDILRKNRSGNP